MKRLVPLTLVVAALSIGAQEPAPRRLTVTDVRLTGDFQTVSGVYELRDGRLLVDDARAATVFIVDSKAGTQQRVGSIGGGALQYAEPGGFYPGAGDSVLLLDRGQAKILLIDPKGEIASSRSIKMNGRSGSSSADVDLQRVDAGGHAYFPDFARRTRARVSGRHVDSIPLIRFDAARQAAQDVVVLRQQETQATIDGPMETSRVVIGSPADAWAVTRDGRVAVAEASPYRLVWYEPDGRVTRGQNIAVESIGYSDAEKAAIIQKNGKQGASIGMTGGAGAVGTTPGGASTPPAEAFAATKPPFEANAVSVAPNGRVWVKRISRTDATTTTFDVFDAKGDRVDRVAVGPDEHIVGFGTAAIYAMGRDAAGRVVLHRYKI